MSAEQSQPAEEPRSVARTALRSAARVVVAGKEHRMPLDQAEHSLYLDSGDRAYRYQRFGLLLVLSSIIATGGIIIDSTATVVGAMVVAPLAVPIMGVALAMVVGQGARLRGAILGVIGGIVVCLFVGAAMSPLLGQESPLTNGQIAGRTSPGLADLAIALATGVVSAVAVIRKDLSDVLPGVAIAIALVPPLCVAGLLLARAEFLAAVGAMTLFATNVLAMILAGVSIFVLVGYARMARLRRKTDLDRRRAAVLVTIAMLGLVALLGVHTVESLQEARTRVGAEQAAVEWVAGTSWKFAGIEYLPEEIVIQILGDGAVPDTDRLLELMGSKVARSVPIVVDAVRGEVVDAGVAEPVQ
jgi:uncharacterized hydrophobic protein (TIGR00271 family)